jgi:hypothetical protein
MLRAVPRLIGLLLVIVAALVAMVVFHFSVAVELVLLVGSLLLEREGHMAQAVAGGHVAQLEL